MPLATSIVLKRKNIFIYDEGGNRLWDAPISYLGATIVDDGTLIPQSFHFLKIQQWMTCRILYQLAKMIQDHYPANDIDWRIVFFAIEKLHFSKTVSTLKDEFTHSPNKKINRWLKGKLVLMDELNTPKGDAWIAVLAERNLREYGVIL